MTGKTRMYRACDDIDNFNSGPLYSEVVFREKAMVVSTYLMPSFDEFQDGPSPVLSLGGEADTRAVKDLVFFFLLD